MMPRYGFTPATEPRPALARPSESASFIARLPAHLGVDILALEAEQHYLRVHTANGSDLILYRLSDAVRELGVRGTQVHRSFWVAAEAITKVCGSSAAPKLLLRNGMEVPVSRSYRLLAQQAGLI